jgi:group I intron endonuclease
MKFCISNEALRRHGGIYMLSNSINDKIYIGSTHDLFERFTVHKERAKPKFAHYYTAALYKEMREIPLEKWTFTVLEIEDDKETRITKENEYMKMYQAKEYGLNMRDAYSLPEISEKTQKKLKAHHYNPWSFNNKEAVNE